MYVLILLFLFFSFLSWVLFYSLCCPTKEPPVFASWLLRLQEPESTSGLFIYYIHHSTALAINLETLNSVPKGFCITFLHWQFYHMVDFKWRNPEGLVFSASGVFEKVMVLPAGYPDLADISPVEVYGAFVCVLLATLATWNQTGWVTQVQNGQFCVT